MNDEASQKVLKNKKQMNIVYKIVRSLCMLIAVVIFVGSSYSLTKSYMEYKKGDEVYDHISAIFEQDVVPKEEISTDSAGETIKVKDQQKEWVWDYNKMLTINPDSVGYIRQENSRIDYPIVQGTDNDYYLTRTVEHTYNKNGSIYVDYRMKTVFETQNCIVYGHNMWSDSMFGTLIQYSKKEYCEENPIFDVYAGNKHYRYYVFASFEADAEGPDEVYRYVFANDKEFVKWQKTIRERSYYQVDWVRELTAEDKVITMSTCTTRNDEGKRVIVMAVRGEEVVD